MKKSISLFEFIDVFEDLRPNNFTRKGLIVLFDYLEDYEDSTGESIDLDVIALCCDFTEYKDLKEFQENYGDKYQSIEDIEKSTTVIPIDDEAFIVQNF